MPGIFNYSLSIYITTDSSTCKSTSLRLALKKLPTSFSFSVHFIFSDLFSPPSFFLDLLTVGVDTSSDVCKNEPLIKLAVSLGYRRFRQVLHFKGLVEDKLQLHKGFQFHLELMVRHSNVKKSKQW